MGEQTYITRFRAQEEGFRQLTTELRSLGTIGDDAFRRIETASGRAGRGLSVLDSGSKSLQVGFTALTRSVLPLVGAVTAIGGIGSVFSSATSAIADFQTEFNNVRTLITDTSVSIDSLRSELLALPPILGSSTELAQGLYQALSAGQSPADAVRFVGEAALFAKAALVDVNTAVDVSTTVLNAYGLAASKTGDVFNDLFNTIGQGKTTGEELSRSLGPLIPIAAQLQIQFDDVTAAIATLTAGGIGTSQAVTSLRATFESFIRDLDRFESAGIDVNAVLGERGLKGVLEELRRVTGGSAIALSELFTRTEALSGILALTGTQFNTFGRNLQENLSTEDSHVAAARKQTEGLNAAWEELSNTWDRIFQKGTVVAGVLESITRATTVFLQRFTLADTNEQIRELNAELVNLETELARAQKGLLEGVAGGLEGTAAVNLFNRLFGRSPDEIIADIARVKQEIENLALTQAGISPEEAQKVYEQQLEERRTAEEKANAERLIEDRKNAEETVKNFKQASDDIIKIYEQQFAEQERIRIQYIRDEDNAFRTIRRFRKELAEDEIRIEQEKQDELDRIAEREQRRGERDAERAAQAAARAAELASERERDRLLRPWVKLGDDISETLSDALVEGFTSDTLFDFIERSWADFVSRLLQANLFDPFFQQITAGLSDSLDTSRVAGQSRTALPAAQTAGGALTGAERGQLLSPSAATVVLLSGVAAQQFSRQLSGDARIALNVTGGVASGAAIGGQVGSGYGAIAGGIIGGLLAGLPELFGTEGSRAQIRTTPTAISPTFASDRFQTRTPFGFVSFTTGGTERLDAAAGARFVAEIDEAIADLITDRQEAFIASVLTQRGGGVGFEFSGDTGDDAIARVVFDRIAAITDALAGRNISNDLFGGYTPNAENIRNIAETATQLIELLGAVDEFRSPTAPLSEAAIAIEALNDRFDDLSQAAGSFGLAAEQAVIEQQRLLERRQLTVDFNEQIRREALAFTDPLGLELELLEERRQAAIANATDLGADITAVERRFGLERLDIIERFAQETIAIEEDRTREIQQLQQTRRSFQFEQQSAILRIVDPLQGALRDLSLERHNALQEAIRIGADINLVEERYAAERLHILERFLEQQQQTLRDFSPIEDFIQSFRSSAESGLTANDRRGIINQAFQDALRGDDINDVIRLADELLQLDRQRLASTPEFFRSQEAIFAALESFRSREQAEDQNRIANEQLKIQNTVAQLIGDQSLRISTGNGRLQLILDRIIEGNSQNDQIVRILNRLSFDATGVR